MARSSDLFFSKTLRSDKNESKIMSYDSWISSTDHFTLLGFRHPNIKEVDKCLSKYLENKDTNTTDENIEQLYNLEKSIKKYLKNESLISNPGTGSHYINIPVFDLESQISSEKNRLGISRLEQYKY